MLADADEGLVSWCRDTLLYLDELTPDECAAIRQVVEIADALELAAYKQSKAKGRRRM